MKRGFTVHRPLCVPGNGERHQQNNRIEEFQSHAFTLRNDWATHLAQQLKRADTKRPISMRVETRKESTN
jgi:hypothetical protein